MTNTKQLKTSYSRKELAEVLDVTTQSVDKWLSNGLPSKKIGKQKVILSVDAVHFFNKTPTKAKHAFRLMEDVGQESIKQIVSSKGGEMDDLSAMLQRSRLVEVAMFDFFKSTTDRSQLIWAAGIHREALEARRKIEKDISEIQLSQSRVIPADEVERKFAEAGQMVKSQLQSLPGKLAGMCEGRKAAEICEIMAKEIHSILEEMGK